MVSNPTFGLNTWTQNRLTRDSSYSTFKSLYNNGFTRGSLDIQSFLPTGNAETNYQAREFSNYVFIPVLTHLGQNGLIPFPGPINLTTDGIPSMSSLTNWGGNPAIAQQSPAPIPQPFPNQPPVMGYTLPQQPSIIQAPIGMAQPYYAQQPVLNAQPVMGQPAMPAFGLPQQPYYAQQPMFGFLG